VDGLNSSGTTANGEAQVVPPVGDLNPSGVSANDGSPSGDQNSPSAPANAEGSSGVQISSGSPANGGAQSGSHEVAGSSSRLASPRVAPSVGSVDSLVGSHQPVPVTQPCSSHLLAPQEEAALPSQQSDVEEVFVDASDGSDIEEFTEDEPSLSSFQAISEFSQSQSILNRAQNVKLNVQSGSVVGGAIVSDVVEVLDSSNLRSKADVDSMDPSLASLKHSRSREPSSKKKHRTVSASPNGGGRHSGLPMVLRDRPT